MKIDKNIPVPKGNSKGQGRPALYPFKKMDVNDSFLVECKHSHKQRNKITTSARNWRFRNNKQDFVFTVRKVKNGYRVWRIK